jgi:phage terminase large subunit-like protein
MTYIDIHLNKLHDYINAITGGTIAAGKLEVRAVQRFLDYKVRYIYKEYELKKVLRFFSLLCYAPQQQLILVDWQVFALANLYALYVDDNTRLFNFAYVEIAKKNGKSSWCAALTLYETLLDNPGSTSNFILASSRDQARISLDYAKLIIENSPAIANLFTVNRNIVYNRTAGVFKKFEVRSSEAGKIQGVKPDFVVVDEYAFHKDSELLFKAKSGQIASQNPLLIAITTAANNPTESPAHELRETCVNVLNGVVEDQNLFALIFSLDCKDEIQTPEVWRKANPSLGITLTLDALIKEHRTAKNLGSKLETFLTDNLNYWTSNFAETWIDDDIIIRFLTNDHEIPRGAEIYVGMDLSSNTDLAAIAVTYYDADRDVFISKVIHIFPNNDKRRIKKGSIDLQRWIDDGYIIRCQTPVLDDELIFGLIEKLNSEHKIMACGYDKYNATIIANRLQNAGVNMVPVSQTVGSLSFPLRIMESYILRERYYMDRSPVTRWQFQNCKLYSDINANRKLDKRGGDSIDGIVALNIAMHQYVENNYNQFKDLLSSFF